MAIDLSLVRITRLLKQLGNPHRSSYNSIHIAGTNGKGSTIAYLSAIFTASRVRTGKFTSPHLISYNDCVAINNESYPMPQFEKVHKMVEMENTKWALGCTEFEVLTATAFKIFQLENVQLALIEVGLGGLLDATNVLEPPTGSECGGVREGGVIACGITKIGIDHESFLGTTLKEISLQKAGIIKPHVPVVVDGTNSVDTLDVVREVAQKYESKLIISDAGSFSNMGKLLSLSPLVGEYQAHNLSVALNILDVLKDRLPITKQAIEEGISKTAWPGRLQSLTDSRTGISFLLDGAHNESAAIELAKYLHTIRPQDSQKGLIFIMAMTNGKAVGNIFKHILEKDLDTVFPVTYSPPENMPFVRSYLAAKLAEIATEYVSDVRIENNATVSEIFQKLAQMRKAGDLRKIVVCGSLYLCSDVLRAI